MSNNWHYKLFFGKEIAFAKRIIKVFEVLELNNIRLNQMQGSPIVIFDLVSVKNIEFYDQSKAIEFLSKEGGLLQVWSLIDPTTEWDFDFYIDFKSPETFPKEDPLLLRKDFFGKLTISIGDYLYRQDYPGDHDREVIASQIKHLYADLCISQNAFYGFSTDEFMEEEYTEYLLRAIPKVITGETPPTYFWLNYFSEMILSIMDREKIILVNGKIESLDKGYFVSFFDYPWQQKISDLKRINIQWKQLN